MSNKPSVKHTFQSISIWFVKIIFEVFFSFFILKCLSYFPERGRGLWLQARRYQRGVCAAGAAGQRSPRCPGNGSGGQLGQLQPGRLLHLGLGRCESDEADRYLWLIVIVTSTYRGTVCCEYITEYREYLIIFFFLLPYRRSTSGVAPRATALRSWRPLR